MNDKSSNNEKDIKFNTNQNTPYFYINKILNLNRNNKSKNINESLRNNFFINKRKEEELDNNKKNKLKYKKLLKILKIPENIMKNNINFP